MTDASLRELERRFRASGSVEDEAAWLRARVKAGDLEQSRLELAAYCGHKPARTALGHDAPDVPARVSEWCGGLAAWNYATARACVAAGWAILHLTEEPNPQFSGPRRALEAAEGALVAPPEGAIAGLGRAAVLAIAVKPPAPSERADWIAAEVCASAAWAADDDPQSGVTGIERSASVCSDPEALLQHVRTELVPWALGYSDPVRDRVEARQREAAGE